MLDEKYKTLAKDTILFGVSTFASKFMIFFLLPIYTNILSTTEYGEADLLINVVNLIYPLLTIAIVEGVLRFAFSKEIKSNELIDSALLIILGATFVLLVLYPFSGLFGRVLSEDWLYLVFLFITYALQNLFSSFCRASGKNQIFAIQGIVQTVCLLLCNLVYLVIFHMGKCGYLLAMISAYIIACIYMVVAGKIYKEIIPLKINKELLKEMLRYSIPLVPSMVSWWMNTSIDKYVIIALVSIEASAIYSVAHKIPTILASISDVFNQAFLISAVKNIDDEENKDFFNRISQYFVIMNCFIASLLMLFSRQLGSILFSKEFFQGWVFVPLLVLVAVFSNLSAFLASFFRTLKNTKILFVSTLVGALTNIVLNIFFVNVIGTIGAAYATIISFVVVFVIRYFCLKRYMNINLLSYKNNAVFMVLFIQAVIISQGLKYMYLVSVMLIILMVALYLKDFKEFYKLIKNKFNKSI